MTPVSGASPGTFQLLQPRASQSSWGKHPAGASGLFPAFSDLLVLSGTHAISWSSACDCTIFTQKTN